MIVSDLMQTSLATVSPAADLEAAARRMKQAGTSYLLAVDLRGRTLGILTRQDIEARIPIVYLEADDAGQGVVQDLALRRTLVSKVMSTALVFAAENDPAEQAAHAMASRRISHLPILRGSKAVGILTRGDLVAARLMEPQLA